MEAGEGGAGDEVAVRRLTSSHPPPPSPSLRRMASIAIAGVAFRAAAPVSANAFVKALPRGAYTTARTCGGGRKVFEFTTHVERLVVSARLMGLEEGVLDVAAMRAALTASISAAVRHQWLAAGLGWGGTAPPAAASALAPPVSPPELKISCLLTWTPAHIADAVAAVSTFAAGDEGALFVDGDTGAPLSGREAAWARVRAAAAAAPWLLITHVTPLPPRRAPPIVVEMHGSPRANALAKDSEWVR
jgi:hypothetical protein